MGWHPCCIRFCIASIVLLCYRHGNPVDAFQLSTPHVSSRLLGSSDGLVDRNFETSYRSVSVKTSMTGGNDETVSTVTSTNKSATSKNGKKPVFQELLSISETLDCMEGRSAPSQDSLVVVKFYSNYCKMCQRTGIQFRKLALAYPQVHFAKVEAKVFSDSKELFRALGVPKFPVVQIYRDGKCVSSFSIGAADEFRKKVEFSLNDNLQRSSEDWEIFTDTFSRQIDYNINVRQQLLQQSLKQRNDEAAVRQE